MTSGDDKNLKKRPCDVNSDTKFNWEHQALVVMDMDMPTRVFKFFGHLHANWKGHYNVLQLVIKLCLFFDFYLLHLRQPSHNLIKSNLNFVNPRKRFCWGVDNLVDSAEQLSAIFMTNFFNAISMFLDIFPSLNQWWLFPCQSDRLQRLQHKNNNWEFMIKISR